MRLVTLSNTYHKVGWAYFKTYKGIFNWQPFSQYGLYHHINRPVKLPNTYHL